MTPEVKERIKQIRHGNVPEGYQETAVGIIPADWHMGTVRECIEEYKLLSNDIEHIPVYSSSRRGLIPQSDYYDQREAAETNLGYKVVPHGYVTYRHMSDDDVFHFNINNTEGEILVSSEYPVFTASSKGQLGFLIPALNGTARFRYFCKTQKLGGTRTRLYLENLKKYSLALAPRDEQDKIAEILAAQDKVIELKEKLLTEKQRQKKYLMQQLLTGKKYLTVEGKGRRKYSFSDVFTTISSKAYQIQSSEYLHEGKYPVVDQGKRKIAGFYNDEQKVLKCPSKGVVVFGDHTRELKFVDFDFIVGADGTQLLSSSTESVLTKYLYYLLCNKSIPNDGYSRHFKYLKEFIYLVPCEEEQAYVVKVLSSIDREIELLLQDLEQEKQKKKALMQLLLTGIVRVHA